MMVTRRGVVDGEREWSSRCGWGVRLGVVDGVSDGD